MAIELNLHGGNIDVGDTKRITLRPGRADGGESQAPASLSLTVTEYRADAHVYETDDFTQDGDRYHVDHTFERGGTCRIEAHMTDANGRSEVTRGVVSVRS